MALVFRIRDDPVAAVPRPYEVMAGGTAVSTEMRHQEGKSYLMLTVTTLAVKPSTVNTTGTSPVPASE
jgi:hypothetical protein